MDKDSFIVYITTGYIHKNIVETRFYASYYELDCNCHWKAVTKREKQKKLMALMKDELGKKGHEKICWIKSKNL